MQQALVVVVVMNEHPKPRRQVMVGKFGPGIARIIVDERFAGAIETEGETVELAPQSVRTG